VWRYEGSTRLVILALKNRNARAVAHALAGDMVTRLEGVELDAVTWAPTSPSRLARRGYDPAELLARGVARRLGLPCRRLLRREPGSAPQSGKDRTARLTGPRFVGRPTAPGRVVVVDDVITTGATLRAAADALRQAGARSVVCLAAAAA
jgi:predicted amidophosphoribosyltransferase